MDSLAKRVLQYVQRTYMYICIYTINYLDVTFLFSAECNKALGVQSGTIQDFQLTSNAAAEDGIIGYSPPWRVRNESDVMQQVASAYGQFAFTETPSTFLQV